MLDRNQISKIAIVREVLAEKQLLEFLKGKFKPVKEYFGDVPTDTSYISAAISLFAKSENDETVYTLYENAILALSKDPELCWFALFHAHSYLYIQKSRSIREVQAFFDALLQNIRQYKNYLEQRFDPPGDKLMNVSLWDEVIRLSGLIQKDHNIDIAKIYT